jgi:hypothetical protein
MHNIFAVVFLVFTPVHIVRNGKALKGYLSKAKNAISKELIAGLILLAIILLGCLLLSEHIAGKHTCDKNNHTRMLNINKLPEVYTRKVITKLRKI